jgi:hypothetical protein
MSQNADDAMSGFQKLSQDVKSGYFIVRDDQKIPENRRTILCERIKRGAEELGINTDGWEKSL